MAQKPYNHSTASRKAGSDFGTANKAAGLIYKLFYRHAKEFWDKSFYKRLQKTAISIINMGSPSRKGSLQFIEGNLNFLELVEFNPLRNLSDFCKFPVAIKLEKADFLRMIIPPITPKKNIHYPYSATSAVLLLSCAVCHFDLEKGGSTALKSLELPIDQVFPGASVKIPLQSAENSVICIAQCIYFKKGLYRLNRPPNKCHAGRIVRVYNMVDGVVSHYQRPDDLIIKSSLTDDTKEEGPDWEMNDRQST